jgi:hypothetical protein
MNLIKEALNSIPVVSEPVGILVSGGTDSAVLLYLLLSKYNSKIHIFSTSAGPRKEVDMKHCLDVVRTCTNITSNWNVEHHITYTEGYAGPAIFDLAHKYVEEERIRWLFTGITKNPPYDVQAKWKDKQPALALDGRDPDEIRDPFRHSEHRKIYPWTNFDKRDIAQLYQKHNLTDTLFPVTRSCVNIHTGDVHCGECWWCNEREWAFGRLE